VVRRCPHASSPSALLRPLSPSAPRGFGSGRGAGMFLHWWAGGGQHGEEAPLRPHLSPALYGVVGGAPFHSRWERWSGRYLQPSRWVLWAPPCLIKPGLPAQSLTSAPSRHACEAVTCVFLGRNLVVNVAFSDGCTHRFRGVFRKAPGKLLGEQRGEPMVPTSKAPSAARTHWRQKSPWLQR